MKINDLNSYNMNFFFSVGSFCLIFSLVALEFRRNVKTDKTRVANLAVIFIISLAFSYLIDMTKWLIIMLLGNLP